jgi:hypothetical protein
MEDDFEFDSEDGDIPSKEELAVWLSEFMSHTAEAETMYPTVSITNSDMKVFANYCLALTSGAIGLPT